MLVMTGGVQSFATQMGSGQLPVSYLLLQRSRTR